MARTIAITVYQYEELDEAAKARARDWWRAVDLGHEAWSEPVTADLKTVAAFMGWTVSDTAFSGFSSQGDGAQFTGTWRAVDVKDAAALEAHAPKGGSQRNAKLRLIWAAFAQAALVSPDATASVSRCGHDAHSLCTRFEFDGLPPDYERSVAAKARALMDWYYRELETAYTDHMSDEQVAEAIEANEYEFKANGERFTG